MDKEDYTPYTFTKEQIEGILKKRSEDTAYGMVLRAKGMVAGADGQWIYFDMVPEEYEVRDGAPEFTGRICVIGSKLAEDKLAELPFDPFLLNPHKLLFRSCYHSKNAFSAAQMFVKYCYITFRQKRV